jgi:cytochrome c oxidase subunit I
LYVRTIWSSSKLVMPTMSKVADTHEVTHAYPSGWRRYRYSTNHKDIGTMYFVFAICAGLIGAIISIVIRMELQQPGLPIFTNPHTYNVFVTGHGLIMIFFTAHAGDDGWIW